MKERTRKIGIEIENESFDVSIEQANQHLKQCVPPAWEIERDGSLRGGQMGWEIKTVRGGLPFDQVSRSLNELYPLMSGCSGVWRAAIHVHVDCTDLNPLQRAYVLCLAYAMDESIFKLVGEDRRESNFCVPMAHKRWHVLNFIRSYAASGDLLDAPCYGKYSSINANSLRNFGTIEFRHMRTPATGGSIESVTEAMTTIRDYARMCHDIVDAAQYSSHITRLDEILPAFLDIVSNDWYWSRAGLSPNMEHVLDVVHMFKGHNEMPTALDIGSVYKVAMPCNTRHEMSAEEAFAPSVYYNDSSTIAPPPPRRIRVGTSTMDDFWSDYLGRPEAGEAPPASWLEEMGITVDAPEGDR